VLLRLSENFLNEAEAKYKAETKAESSEALDYSEVVGVIN